MSDIEAENKNLKEEQSEVSAPTEIGAPSVGSKDIRWYVIHTYSGYENKVKDTLTRKVHSMGMDDTILEILLPLQDEEEKKDGKTRVVAHKVFPGYLLIKMEVNDRSWYVSEIPLASPDSSGRPRSRSRFLTKKQTASFMA